MKQIKFFIALVAISLSCTMMKAQIKIIDLSVIPAVYVTPQSADSTDIVISFKAQHPENITTVKLLLGSQSNNSSIANYDLVVQHTSGTHSIEIEGKSFTINGYQANFTLPLTTAQYNSFSLLTLYVVSSDGTESEHLLFNK